MATQEAVVHGAAVVFEKYGFGEASLSEITRVAGVTKGALYFHYESKELLALSVIEEQHRIASEAGASITDSGLSAVETIIRILRSFSDLLHNDVVVRAGIRLTFEASAFSVSVAQPYKDWASSFEELVQKAINEGDVRGDVNPEEIGRLIVGSYTGVQMVSNVLADRRDLLAVAKTLCRYLLPSIVAKDRQEIIPKLLSSWD